MTKRKTDVIRFNIFDRGRKYTGADRGNVDPKTWIDLFNSPETQELIETGGALGYYGHQIRLLYGLNPPETVVLAGRFVPICPAVKTIELRCDDKGNVEHRQEFLQTAEGDHALERYKAKVGGFSAAHGYKKVNGIVYPDQYSGMDYVHQPNYASNASSGVLLDSIKENSFLRQQLEISALEMYDSIHQTQFANHVADEYLERALKAEDELLEQHRRAEKRKKLIAAKQENMFDSCLCETMPFDEYLKGSSQFLTANVAKNIDEENNDAEQGVKEKYQPKIGLFGLIKG